MGNETQMLPQLIGGSVINLQVGSAFVSKIQECFQIHITGHEDELKKLTAIQGNYDNEALSEWENITVMYSTLLQGLMKSAEQQGLIEMVPLETVLKQSMPATQKTQEED